MYLKYFEMQSKGEDILLRLGIQCVKVFIKPAGCYWFIFRLDF